MGLFTTDTSVTQVAENVWRGELQPGWLVGKVLNGGYVLAVVGRVLSQALPHADPLAVNAFYLAPTEPGPVECRVEVLRQGRNTSHGEVKLYQHGELRVQVTAAYTDLETLHGEDWSAEPAPKLAPPDACELLRQRHMAFSHQVDRRLEDISPFTTGQGNGSGEFRGWISHVDGADPDALSLLLFADMFPPPVITLFGPLPWVPTVELGVQVRAHPAPGPISARLVTRHLSRGIVEEDGEYWDSEGTLVALSRQTAKVRVP